jgi:threonine dehydratase
MGGRRAHAHRHALRRRWPDGGSGTGLSRCRNHPRRTRRLGRCGQSLATGTIQKVSPNAPATLCDALQTPATRDINFAILKERCAYALWVSPAEVAEAQRLAFRQLRLVVEPGGAAALAAVLAGKAPVDGRTAVMLTGEIPMRRPLPTY